MDGPGIAEGEDDPREEEPSAAVPIQVEDEVQEAEVVDDVGDVDEDSKASRLEWGSDSTCSTPRGADYSSDPPTPDDDDETDEDA